jgi:hypothetical protein
MTESVLAPSLFLTEDEVRALSGKIKRDAQVRALRAMGVEHRVRPDGSVAVLRDHIHKVFDGTPGSAKRGKPAAPNWDAI